MGLMYAIGWLDAALAMWPSAGLDYSGHSGFVTVLVLSLFLWSRVVGTIAFGVFALYAVLMLYQRYHTVADILTTVVVVAATTWGVHWTARKVSGPRAKGS
jgi:hypothetical protein